MYNLDDRASYETVDASHMHQRLAGLAQQCSEAYEQAKAFPLPARYRDHDLRRVIMAGMGGPGIGASLVQALCEPTAAIPVCTWRNYGLPAYASGPSTLVIASSTSGDTEETVSAFEAAVERGCRTLVLSAGGALARLGKAQGAPLFQFHFAHQPREAIGWLTFPLIACLENLGILPECSADVGEATALMHDVSARLGIDSPAVRNPAKRMAGQVMQRLPIIYGAGLLAPVARRWKTMLNENAKLLAAWDEMPELNHNSVMGFEQDEAVWQKSIVIQLRSDYDDPRIARRFDLTTRLMLEAGVNQDTIRAKGRSALAQVFSLVQFGDWVSYYAAIMAGVDPTPVPAIEELKHHLSGDTS